MSEPDTPPTNGAIYDLQLASTTVAVARIANTTIRIAPVTNSSSHMVVSDGCLVIIAS